MRVLIVSSRFPMPAWRGNQVRTVEWLRALDGADRALICPWIDDAALRHRLTGLAETVCCFRQRPERQLWGAAAAVAGDRPVQEGLYSTVSAQRAVAKVARTWNPDVVVVQMVRCGWSLDVARSEVPRAAVVFDAIDAMGLHFERAATRAPRVLKPVYRAESLRCRRREHRLASRAEIVTAVSDRDLEALSVPAERGRVVPVSGREIVPTDPKPATPTVLLSGNLGYRPTVEAARWFGEQVWHRILDRTPGARWLLVGARPNRTVRRLARLPGVEVHADVGDLRPYMAQAHVAIAPMESGSGAPMKVIEAWSAGVPVVVGRWAAAGLDPAGVAAVEVASTPDEWVTTLHHLLTEPESAARLGRRGREVWESHYRFDRIAEEIRSAITDAIHFVNRKG